MENGLSIPTNDARARSAADEKESIPSKAKNPAELVSPGGHKRRLSGSILSFPFFGGSQIRQDANKSAPRAKPSGADPIASPRTGGGAMASAMQHKKARKRKGSLRKTALLRPGKTILENKDEAASGAEPDRILQLTKEKSPQPAYNSQQLRSAFKTNQILSGASSRTDTHTTESLPYPPIPSNNTTHPNSASTTDDDDLPPLAPFLKPPIPSSPDSYFPPQPPPHPAYRARPPSTKSPLSSLPASFPPSPSPEWDYAETRAWGWLLLACTWLVFVVGMGSCFGVWSWAWDVGETPYAPPELEDDPTLPIVGYYPALIILTGVMAWVWVVVAWVGMKYFRHAKISGEEG